ncbi:1170_t:CDS:2, partial [Funneliformis caledonium]
MKFLKERDPKILAIVAGNSDYVPLVEHALEKGWKVEIWFWSLGLSGEYKKFTYSCESKSPRKFTFEIKHKCIEVLKEELLLQLII